MPINSKHPDYTENFGKWRRCRDAAEGSDKIKEQKSLYLPMLEGMTSSDYDAYLKRALWYGATARTVQGLRGAVFRKPPVYEIPGRAMPLMDTITDDNLDLESLAQEVIGEQLTTGRQGLLVDLPAEERNGQPYVVRYQAEQIISWRSVRSLGREQLIRVVLEERALVEDETDPWMLKEQVTYRVLRLTNEGYVQELYDENGLLLSVYEPRRVGSRLDFIPFRFVNSNNMSVEPEKPPLLDLVEVNLSHYRTSADLEHGAHFTALPTPWLAGFPMDKKFAIGSGVAFVTDNESAKAGMLEFTGQGLNALRDLRQDKEHLMAVLGARMLEEQKREAEAAETARLNRSGESGALSSMVRTASAAIKDVIGWSIWWAGMASAPSDIPGLSFELNTDFLDIKISSDQMNALLGALQAGRISVDTWLYNLHKGEILPPNRTIAEEMSLIETDAGGIGVPSPEDNEENAAMEAA